MAKKKKRNMITHFDLFPKEKAAMFTFLVEDMPGEWIEELRLMNHAERIKWLAYNLFIENLRESVES